MSGVGGTGLPLEAPAGPWTGLPVRRAASAAAGPAAANLAAELDAFTDPAVLRPLLQSRLPGYAEGQLRIEDLQVDHVRRSTSRSRQPVRLSLQIVLHVIEPASGRRGAQWLVGQVRRPGAAAPVPPRRLATPDFGTAHTFLSDLALALWALPNDPGLPQLPRLMDAARAARRLQRGGLAAPGAPVTVELLRHVPGSRAALRYCISGTPDGPARTVYAKTIADDRSDGLHRRFQHFWLLSARDAQAPRVAQPLGHDPLTRTLWQAEAQGEPLARAGTAVTAQQACVARALARVHAAPLALADAAPPHDVAQALDTLQHRMRKLARIDTSLADAAAPLAEALHTHVGRAVAPRLQLIHGDCHAGQFWADGDRVCLFDLDECAPGDPMEDLAAYVVRLPSAGLPPSAEAGFLQAYAQAAPQAFCPRRLAWHAALQAVMQLTRSFVFQRPGWREALPQRLFAARSRVDALREAFVR